VSDTPRTDECIVVYPEENAHDMYVWADFARKLERENATLRADKERLDWLSTESGSKWAHHESDQCNITRRAIDAARKAQP
jgi:hypothetical protein